MLCGQRALYRCRWQRIKVEVLLSADEASCSIMAAGSSLAHRSSKSLSPSLVRWSVQATQDELVEKR